MKHPCLWLRALAASVALVASLAPPAAPAASTVHPDYSDLWWNASESGWGAQLSLQGDVMFLTLFVHGADGNARFFVASDMRVANTLVAGETLFTGILYRTTGPHFAGPYDARQFDARPVGSATLRFASPNSATLSYDVDGASVTKAITRQTFRDASLAGNYHGGLFAAAANCTSGTGASAISYPGSFTVTRTGTAITIASNFSPGFASGGICRYDGSWSQEGRMGAISGSYRCEFLEEGPAPVSGTFQISAIEFGETGWSGRYSGREGAACVHTGRFGGLRRGYADPVAPAPDDE